MTSNDFDFAKKLGEKYEEVISIRQDSDYEINPTQMNKFLDCMLFLIKAAERLNGTIKPVESRPREIHGEFTAYFPLFDLWGEQIQQFISVLQDVSAISFDIERDLVCVSITIPNVFAKKE